MAPGPTLAQLVNGYGPAQAIHVAAVLGIPDHLAAMLHGHSAPQLPRHSTLTLREREVLELVAQGYSNTTVAGQLGISPKTVDTHRTRLMEKLGLHSRAGLTHYALQHGYMIGVA